MLAVIGVIVVVVIWRFIVLTAAVVFERAGLSPVAAAFQARSALTGSGYTTAEAEVVVTDPAARQAASVLFILGFIGPVTILGLLGLGFLLPSSTDLEQRVAVLVTLLALYLVLERTGINVWLLRRPAQWAAGLFGASPERVWRVVGDHAILVLPVSSSPLATGQPLSERPFADARISVLGIHRSEPAAVQYIANPTPDEVIRAGDQLVLYGPLKSLGVLRSGKR